MILVAGIGNIFLGDDGFGVEVARRLLSRGVPEGVRVVDFGIRGIHLACDLLDGRTDLLVLVDAAARGGAPGTVYVIEPDTSSCVGSPDAHSLTPEALFAMLRAMGGEPGRVRIVACEPLDIEEGIGLSPVVEAAVDQAVGVVLDLIEKEGRDARVRPV